MSHVEFPALTPEAEMAMSRYDNERIGVNLGWHRRNLAAFLREAIEQADPIRPGFESRLCAIADNLHNPPPPPLTPTQMYAILQDLNAAFGSQIGPEWTSDPFEALQRGIAHYCKVQP